jgi:N-acetylneuraminic acid mutarotase
VLDGLVFIIGAGDSHRHVLRFDPGSEQWSTLAASSSPRICSVSYVIGGCLYAAGGDNRYSSVERHDAKSNTWTVVDLSSDRSWFGAVTIGSAQEQDILDSLIANALSRQP